MRKVVVLGFCEDENLGIINEGRWPGYEVWTFNDWWNFYKSLKHPSRVYQIHNNWNGCNRNYPWRDTPEWREKYDESGAQCVLSNSEGLKNERLFNIARCDAEFGNKFLGSTISYMLVDAIWEGVKCVEFKGVKMLGDMEHMAQVPNLLWNIETARSRGVNIHCPFEKLWIEMFKKNNVDWRSLKEVSMRYGTQEVECAIKIMIPDIDEKLITVKI